MKKNFKRLVKQRKKTLQEYYKLIAERDKINRELRGVRKSLAQWDKYIYVDEEI